MDIIAAIRAFLAACQICTCPCHVTGDVDLHAHVSWECYQAESELKEILEKKDSAQ